MPRSDDPLSATSLGRASFRTTHWSVGLAAAERGSPGADEALAKLCQVYWYPLYAFIRRRGHGPEEAEDLTQEFFARLVDRNHLAGITIEGGKFRSYMLTVLKHFLTNERERALTQKRGGHNTFFSIDDKTAENRYQFEPVDHTTPESIFERHWALTLLDRVMGQLRDAYAAEGKAEFFERLRPCLSGAERLVPYSELGTTLGLSEGALKVAVHRLRKRYGALLRAEIADTVSSPEEIDEEIRHLIEVTAR
jgi:RNA polymerase sigma factor (sigma-70 family)